MPPEEKRYAAAGGTMVAGWSCGERERDVALFFEGTFEAAGAVLAEEASDTVLDHIDVVGRGVVARGQFAPRHLAGLNARVDVEITARDVLLLAKRLKGADERAGTELRIHLLALVSAREHVGQGLGRLFDVLGVALVAFAAVGQLGASLPPQGVEPVAFRPRLLFVSVAVLLEHQLVEGLLHGVLAVGEAVGVVQAVHEGSKELLVECGPGGGIGERDDGHGIELHLFPF